MFKKKLFTLCCLISTPSFLPANLTPSSSIGGRTPSSLDRISPLLILIMWSITQVTTYTAAWGGDVAIPRYKQWKHLFKTPKTCSTRTLVSYLRHFSLIFLSWYITYAILLSTPLYISLHETKIRSRGKQNNWFVAILQANKQKTWNNPR